MLRATVRLYCRTIGIQWLLKGSEETFLFTKWAKNSPNRLDIKRIMQNLTKYRARDVQCFPLKMKKQKRSTHPLIKKRKGCKVMPLFGGFSCLWVTLSGRCFSLSSTSASLLQLTMRSQGELDSHVRGGCMFPVQLRSQSWKGL